MRSFAGEYGLDVAEVDAGRRAVTLRGTVDAMARGVWRAGVAVVRAPDRRSVPRAPGTTDDPARARRRDHRRVRDRRASASASPTSAPRSQRPTRPSYTPLQVAAAYNFPTGVTGAGETVGIIELGGGFSQSDLDTYFSGPRGLTAPTVTAVGVDGGTNSPGTNPDADGEVMLDIEVLGSVAPGREDRRLLLAQHRPGLHRRGLDRGARHHQQAERGLDQLGRPRGLLDSAGQDADGAGVDGGAPRPASP